MRTNKNKLFIKTVWSSKKFQDVEEAARCVKEHPARAYFGFKLDTKGEIRYYAHQARYNAKDALRWVGTALLDVLKLAGWIAIYAFSPIAKAIVLIRLRKRLLSQTDVSND